MWEKIETIIQRADNNLNRSMTEERTKQFLIEPILMTLGWDLTNPDVVQREYKQVVDYALFGKQVTIFLEAKRLGSHLDSAMQQVLQYAIEKDIKPDFVLTTDGIQWNCVSMRYRSPLFSVNLRNPSKEEKQLFLLLSKDSVDKGALTNYANMIRTEEEVLSYLKQHASQIASEIHAYDSIFEEQTIIDYIEHLANQSLITIKVEEPAPLSLEQPSSTTEKAKKVTAPWTSHTASSIPGTRSTSSWVTTYDISALDRQYLQLVAQRIAEMQKQVGEPLFVRFGITGNWDTPNYQVETASGRHTWTFHGRGRQQKPFRGARRFNPNKITAERYSLEDILKVLRS